MEAILVPQRNAAVLLEGDCWRGFISPGGVEIRDGSVEGALAWLHGAEGAIFLEDVTPEEAEQRLRWEANLERTFRLFLPLFDQTFSLECRTDVARAIDGPLASDDAVACQLAYRFSASPFPKPDQLEAAIELTRSCKATRLRGFLLTLRNHQPLIRRVASAWDQISDRLFLDSGPREEIRTDFVEHGNFLRLIDTLAEGGDVTKFVRRETTDRRGPRPANFQALLESLIEPFLKEYTRKSAAEFASLRSTVERRKAEIIDAVSAGDPSNAAVLMERLVAFELEHEGSRSGGITLCDLAQRAKDRSLHGAQFDFAEAAADIDPSNLRCWKQLADARKRNGQAVEALNLYEDILAQSPNDVVARNGRAEVLRDLNRLDEALAAYDETIGFHKDNVVARTGRAEVLRDLNRLEEALAAYDGTITSHKDNVHARTGQAEVLRDLNRLDDALAAYDETIASHNDNVYARNGRAEVLRALNRLEDALAAYGETIASHKDNVVARNGRAEVLRDLNRLDDALAAYDDTIAAHKDNVVARNGRAEILRDLNRLDDALAAYNETIASYKDNVVARTGRAEVLRDLNRLDEALAAYNDAIAAHGNDVVARNGRAEVLRDLNRLEEALAAYDGTIASHKNNVYARTGRAEVLRDLNRLEEALAAYDDAIAVQKDNVVARNGRANLLGRLGRFPEAFALLPTQPRTQDEWVGFHVRGMLHLQRGEAGQAREIFQLGMRSAPRRQAPYFQSAFAFACLFDNRPEQALASLTTGGGKRLSVAQDVIRSHALGALGREDECKAALLPLRLLPNPRIHVIVEEIDARFVKHAAAHTEAWLFQEEAELLQARSA